MGSESRTTSVKEILIEMKTLSEICVDLAFASLMYFDKLLAEQVMVIEKKIDNLHSSLLDHLSLSIKNKSQAEQLRIYFKIGEATNLISDSAADIASLVLLDYEVQDEIRHVQRFMEQVVDLVQLNETSPLCGETELSCDTHDMLGIDIIGIFKPGEIFSTEHDELMESGDMLVFRGPLVNVNEFISLAKGDISSIEEARYKIIEEGDFEPEETLHYHQDLLVTMKESAELLVDLAYLYALEGPSGVKKLIWTTEDKVDKLQNELTEEVLRLFKTDLMDLKTLMAYLRMADSFEEIADAAIKIAFGVTAQHKPYTLLEEVVDDSSEAVDFLIVSKDSSYIGKTIKEVELTDDFFQILAIKKKGRFFFLPDDKVPIRAGDGLVIKTYSSPDEE